MPFTECQLFYRTQIEYTVADKRGKKGTTYGKIVKCANNVFYIYVSCKDNVITSN